MVESCITCEKVFQNKFSLNRHMKVVHQEVSITGKQKFSCLECIEVFNSNSLLRDHLETNHNFANEVVELWFEKFADFENWLKNEEMQENTRYIKTTGMKKTSSNVLKCYFECARSLRNNFHIKEKRKRALKSQGSCKMPFACTSQIIVTETIPSNQVSIKYCKTHFGHGKEIEHIRISKTDREMIAGKLMLGVPTKRILSSVRENIGNHLTRTDMLMAQDVTNIKKAYNIDVQEGCRNKDDATSVDIWVEECLLSDHPIQSTH